MDFLKKLLCLIILVTTKFSPSGSAQSLDAIIDKHVAAIGGAEKLAALKSIKITETTSVKANMPALNMDVPYVTTIVHNKSFMREAVVQGMTIVEVINENSGWIMHPMINNGKASPYEEDIIKTMKPVTNITGLYHYKEDGYNLKLDGEEDFGGIKSYKVSLVLKNGINQVHYIAQDSYYVIRVVDSRIENGKTYQSELRKSNFQEVEGIMFPFATEQFDTAIPGVVHVSKIESIEVNPLIDPAIFKMPN